MNVSKEIEDQPVRPVKDQLFPPGYELLPGVNQIYELDFAYSELKTMNEDELIQRSAFFRTVDGKETLHYRMCKGSVLEVDDGTSIRLRTFMKQYQFKTGYATHGLFPYRGKFHPQLAKAMLNLIRVKPGEIVLDPMMGSATLNLEASLAGIDSIGVDVSPFCVFMSKVKILGLSLDPTPLIDCLNHVEEVFSYFHSSEPLFPKETVKIAKGHDLPFLEDKSYQDYLKLCYFDALGYAQRRKNKDVRALFELLLTKYVNAVVNFARVRNELSINVGKAKLFEGDARKLREAANLSEESIDGIVTSPPYSFAIDYLKGDKTQLEFMGQDIGKLKEKMIGLRGVDQNDQVEKYLADMEKVIAEMFRVLKKGRYVAIVIGTNESQLQKVATFLSKGTLEDSIIKISKKIGFQLAQKVSRPIEGIRNSFRDESIIFLRKS